MRKYCLMVLMALAGVVWGQPPDTVWTRRFGGVNSDEAYSLALTPDGGCVMAGLTYSYGAGDADVYLVKVDSNGVIEWQRTYGGPEWDVAYAIQRLLDGGFILSGMTQSFGIGTPTRYNTYILRTDSSGDTLWTRAFGGELDDWCYDITDLSNGEFVAAGFTRSYGAVYDDIFLLRVSSTGDSLQSLVLRGPHNERAYSVARSEDGGFLVSGAVESYGYIVRLNSALDTLWSRTYPGSSPNHDLSFGRVLCDLTARWFLVGNMWPWQTGHGEIYVSRIDDIGDTLWTRTIADSFFTRRAYAAKITADGSVAIVGLTGDPGPFDYYPNTYVARVASDGAMLWDTIYGLPEGDTGYDIEILPDGGYLIAGSYWRSLSSTRDVYVVRTLPDPMAIESREPLAMATHFALTAYPNPFNAVCRLSLELDQPGHVNLDVFDLTGRLVKQLVNARLNRGSHSLVLDGSVLPTGVYFVQARVGNRQETLKLLLLR